MRQLLVVLAIASMLLFASAGVASAEHGTEPVGGCPDGFMLHHMHEMHGGHHHHHIGNDADQNGDLYLCVKHVGKGGKNHVHIDNNVPCDPDPSRCEVHAHGM
ncbi:MAG: hypothetical protein H3C34_17125 [Caldilineaceae bacterium]|nr:hypothetical protein [Caldilineaceae bacterium]